MKVFGKPEYLNLYYRYFAPLLAGIDTSSWDVLLYLWPSEEMPKGMQGTRPVFSPPKTIRIPIVHLPNVAMETYAKSQESIIAHEYGHYVHTAFMGKDGSEKWQEWAELTGSSLDFQWTEKYAAHPYRVVPSYEDFAWDFSCWLQGKRWHMERFYMSLWGQEAKATIQNIAIHFQSIMDVTGKAGQAKLKELLEKDNPRALLYL